MSKYRNLIVTTAAALVLSAPAFAGQYGLGRPALPEEIAAWDKDVAPDGTGLPAGSGSVEVGEEVFAEQCAICHGDFAEGVDNWPKLAGGADTLADKDPAQDCWILLALSVDYLGLREPLDALWRGPDPVQ